MRFKDNYSFFSFASLRLITVFTLTLLFAASVSLFPPSFLNLTSDALAASAAVSANPPVRGRAGAGNVPGLKSGYVELNFRNVDITTLIKFISKITGRNFIYSGKIKGKVTIVSSRKIKTEEAYKAFLAALSYHGLTVVKSGGIYSIIKTPSARQNSIPVSEYGIPASGNEFVTRIFNLNYMSSQSMDAILIPLLSASSNIESYMPTNSLIVTDYASNVRKATRIIDALDVPNFGQKVVILHIKYVPVKKIAGILGLIYTGSTMSSSVIRNANAQFVRIIPYGPTNSLVIMASPLNVGRIVSMVNKLDLKSETSSATVHVYRLKFAEAGTIAKILTKVSSKAKKVKGLAAGQTAINPPAAPKAASTGAASASGGGVALVGKSVIIPDKQDNSLIIESTPAEYNAIKAVIGQLDVKRRQVFVQVIIAEVDLTRSSEIGAQYYGPKGNFFGYGSYNMSQGISTFLTNPFSVNGFILGTAGGSMTLPIGVNGAEETVPSFAALFRLIQTDSDINVLSAPDLLTLDNQKASIMVGEDVPFVTSSATSQMELQNIVTQVERQDVGVKVEITPTINQGDYMMLKVNIDVTAIAASPDGLNASEVGPTTSKRKVKTDILVKNGQTVLLGGLIQNTVNTTVNKVPLLGDIPLLGYLFKDKSTSVEKDDLVVLINPIIIGNDSDISNITNKKNVDFKAFMKKEGQKLPGYSNSFIINPSYFPVKTAIPAAAKESKKTVNSAGSTVNSGGK